MTGAVLRSRPGSSLEVCHLNILEMYRALEEAVIEKSNGGRSFSQRHLTTVKDKMQTRLSPEGFLNHSKLNAKIGLSQGPGGFDPL